MSGGMLEIHDHEHLEPMTDNQDTAAKFLITWLSAHSFKAPQHPSSPPTVLLPKAATWITCPTSTKILRLRHSIQAAR